MTSRKLTLVCFGVAIITFIFRILHLFFTTADLSLTSFPDETNYYLPAAQMILSDRWGFFSSPRVLWNGPLQPLWVALWGVDVTRIKIVHIALFSVASGLLCGGIAKRISPTAAIVAAVALLLYEPFLVFVPTVLTEPLYVSLLMISLSIILIGHDGVRLWAYSGILVGLATLVRPTSQLLPFLFLLLALLPFLPTPRQHFFALGFGALLCILPIATYNFIMFGKLGIANGSGAVLYLGNDFRRNGDEPLYSGVDFDTFQHTSPHTHLDSEGDRLLTKVALSRISENPGAFIALTLQKIPRYLFGSGISYFYPFANAPQFFKNQPLSVSLPRITALLLTVIVSIGGFLGLFRLPKILGWYLGVFILYFVGLHAITFPIPRLYLPLYPFLLVATCGFVTRNRSLVMLLGYLLMISITLGAVGFRPANHFPTEVEPSKVRFFSLRGEGTLSATNGISRKEDTLHIDGPDPYLVYALQPVPLSRNQLVSVSYGVSCAHGAISEGTAQIFWGTSEQVHFAEERALSFAVRGAAPTHLVRPALLPTWVGTLTALRLDFPESYRSCAISHPVVKVVE